MTSHTSFVMPTAAEVDKYISQAHLMRSDYISQSIKSGLTRLLGLFALKTETTAATT